MESPGTTENFNYLDKVAWDNYVKQRIIPLQQSAARLLSYYHELSDLVNGHSLDEFEKNETIAPILLGGLKDDGTFTDRSLCSFYHDSLGIDYDYSKYIAEVSEGVEPSDVEIRLIPTSILAFTSFISTICNSILNSIGVEPTNPTIDARQLLRDPKSFVAILKEFHEHCLNLTAGYDKASFFVWSLRKNTRKYINAAYGMLEEDKAFEKLSDFLGLKEVFIPDMPDPKKYTIWGYPEFGSNYYMNNAYFRYDPTNFGSTIEQHKSFLGQSSTLGGRICVLNEEIWNYLRQSDVTRMKKIFPNLPDAKKEYVERTASLVNGKPLLYAGDYYSFQGLSITWSGSRSKGYALQPPILLTRALDNLSPFQFLGLYEFQVSANEDRKSGQISVHDRRSVY